MTGIFSGRSRSAVAAFALGLGAALSFTGQAMADPKVLAKVDGAPITDEDVADAMVDIGPGLPQKLEGAARQKYVLDYLVDLRLAAKKAEFETAQATAQAKNDQLAAAAKQAATLKANQESLLSQTKGQLATLVAADQARRDAAAKAAALAAIQRSRTTTAAWRTPGRPASAASISPSSMRKPRTLT